MRISAIQTGMTAPRCEISNQFLKELIDLKDKLKYYSITIKYK